MNQLGNNPSLRALQYVENWAVLAHHNKTKKKWPNRPRRIGQPLIASLTGSVNSLALPRIRECKLSKIPITSFIWRLIKIQGKSYLFTLFYTHLYLAWNPWKMIFVQILTMCVTSQIQIFKNKDNFQRQHYNPKNYGIWSDEELQHSPIKGR